MRVLQFCNKETCYYFHVLATEYTHKIIELTCNSNSWQRFIQRILILAALNI